MDTVDITALAKFDRYVEIILAARAKDVLWSEDVEEILMLAERFVRQRKPYIANFMIDSKEPNSW